MGNLRFALKWCLRAASVDRVTALALLLLAAGLAAAWLVPPTLILMSGQYTALALWPFMSLALTTFFVIPPYLFLAPRLLVWDGHIEVRGDEVVLDMTTFKNPADLADSAATNRVKWQGTPCLLQNGSGGFFGRLSPPTVSTQSYYRAMHKPDLLQYTLGKPSRLRDVQLGLLAVMGLGALFVGLLAVAE